jgi:uncharacterized protein
MIPTLVIALTLVVVYWLPIRRWMGRWGTTSSDLTRVMAGDGLLADPTYSGTMAVIINARPEHIWPWLLQMGHQRGGLYSYDWLDRLFGFLDRPSATSILPEFQHLAVGDEIPLGRGPNWPVGAIEPRRALVLDMRNIGDFDWVWQFGLYAIDENRTQLVSRSRVRPRSVWARLGTYAIEPAGFVMTRRMLLGLKQRAEALAARPVTRPFIQRHPVATYYVLVFAISWGGGAIVLGPGGILGGRAITAAQLPFVYLTAMAGPSVAGIVSTALVRGRAGVLDLLSRLLRWRVSVRWYAVALLTAPLLVTPILFALSLTSPAFLPTIVTASNKTGLLVSGIAVGLVIPPFEELGWTGFAVPQLRTRYGIVTTGIIVGLLWGAWHFPLFAESARSSAAVPPTLYLAVLLFSWLPPYRVLMVWVYDRTQSVLLAMLMHLPIVVISLVLVPSATPKVILTYDLIFGSALWILVVAVAVRGARGGAKRFRGAWNTRPA